MTRGDVYWADLVPRRPVIVVSHDAFNAIPAWMSILVVPQGKRGPTAVEIPAGSAGLPRTTVALCHQVTMLDRSKLTKRIGSLRLKAALDIE